MVYIAKESDFRSGTKQGDVLEWIIPFKEPIPQYGITPYDLAHEELEIFRGVQADITEGNVSAPIVFDDNRASYEVTKPPDYGAKKGQPWNCRYCNHNALCQILGPGTVSIEMATFHGNNLAEETI
jgi:hypothetical protein